MNHFRVLSKTLGAVLLAISVFSISAIAQDGKDEKDESKPDRAAIIKSLKLTQEQADAIKVTADGNSQVFTLGQSGGRGAVLGAKGEIEIRPLIKVFADGTIKVKGGRGVDDMTTKFSEAELIEFLHFVVNTNQFYEVDSADLKKQMVGKGKTKILDATSTEFVLELAKGQKRVTVYALWNAAKEFPDIAELNQLTAIEKRCQGIVTRANLGESGPEVLKLVNVKVAELNLGLDPFAIDEVRNAKRMGNGRFQVSFQRNLPGVKIKRTAPATMHVIYFKKDANAQAEVSFFGIHERLKSKK